MNIERQWIKHDDYMTPKSAWEHIAHLIPRDKIIWEPFYGDGKSGQYLRELGFNVIHEPLDFFTHDLGEIIVSNPPYSISEKVLHRMKLLNKPFIFIMPVSKITTQYFRELFYDDISVIIPKKRIHFQKQIDGKVPEGWGNQCNFDCFYYCWKIPLPKQINWL